MRRILFVSLFAFVVSGKADRVDNYLEAQLRNRHIPGASLVVLQDGKILKVRGYGLANIEQNAPAAAETVYEIGSNTKQFTAAAIMLLVEEGKLALDDGITKFFPEAPKTWSGITIRHLLNHTSGIQDHVAVPGWLNVFKTSITSETTPSRAELLELFFKLPLEFQPGETWAYDNTGYYLLGIIIEKASGKSYWDFLAERIFKPLGMTATRNTNPQPIVSHRASGYDWVKDHFENRPVLAPFIAFSAGSILSTVEDMAKWDAALSSEKLLKRASLNQIWTAAKTNDGAEASFDYGFGWFIGGYHKHRFVQHSGGTPGFSSAIYRFLDDRLTIVLLTNHSDCIVDSLVLDLAGMYVPALQRTTDLSDADPKTTLMLKDVVSGLLQENYNPDSFTPPMQLFLKSAVGKGLWKWFAAHGELESFLFSDREDGAHGPTLHYKMTLGGNPYWFSCKVTNDGKIAQIFWW